MAERRDDRQQQERITAREPKRELWKMHPGEVVLDLNMAADIEETSPAASKEKHRHPHSE